MNLLFEAKVFDIEGSVMLKLTVKIIGEVLIGVFLNFDLFSMFVDLELN